MPTCVKQRFDFSTTSRIYFSVLKKWDFEGFPDFYPYLRYLYQSLSRSFETLEGSFKGGFLLV